MPRRVSWTVVLVLLSVPARALADNTTALEAYSLMIGGTPAEALVSGTSPTRWYRTAVRAGRSYCVETQAGVHFDASPMAGSTDPTVTVWGGNPLAGLNVIAIGQPTVASDGTQVILSEPAGGGMMRACFIASTTDQAFIEVGRWFDWAAFNIRVRMVETTLFSNWFFVGGDYSAFTLLRNTTTGHLNAPVQYTVTWRNGSGQIVASHTGFLDTDAATHLNARDFPGALASGNGTVDIAHNGSPDALVASTTVLSGSTGLSFDAPFKQRQSW